MQRQKINKPKKITAPDHGETFGEIKSTEQYSQKNQTQHDRIHTINRGVK